MLLIISCKSLDSYSLDCSEASKFKYYKKIEELILEADTSYKRGLVY